MKNIALMTVHGADGPPSLASAAEELGVAVDDLDREFGVVLIDPRRGLYSVQVDAERIPDQRDSGGGYRGPFSSPRIDTFGPPSERKKKGR